MRIALFLVLLANLILVLWQTQIQQNGEPVLPEIPASKRLVLVKEQQESVAADSADGDSIEPEKDIGIKIPDLGLPDIEILGVSQPGQVESEPESEPEPEEPKQLCYTMGPFKQIALSKKVIERLKDIGAAVSQRSKIEQEQYGYQVFLKPYATREEAALQAHKLADNGVRDYYIISDDPEKKNGISLGLFRKKSGAIRRMAQVRRFDFKPHMEIRYRETTIYWLDFEHTDDIDSESLWRELTEETPELQRLDRGCNPTQQ